MKAKTATTLVLMAAVAAVIVLMPTEALAASEAPAGLIARFVRFADGWIIPNTFADTDWSISWRTTATVLSTVLTMTWILYLNVKADEKKPGSGGWLGWIGKVALAVLLILFFGYWIFGTIMGKYNSLTTGFEDGFFSAEFKSGLATVAIWILIIVAIVLMGGIIWKVLKLIPGIAKKIWSFVMGAGDASNMGWRVLGALVLSGLVINNAAWNSMQSVPWPYFWSSFSSAVGLGVIVYGVGFSNAGSSFFLRILKKERMDGSAICQYMTTVYLNGQAVVKNGEVVRSPCGGNIPPDKRDREGNVDVSVPAPMCNRCNNPKRGKCTNCDAEHTHRHRKCPNCNAPIVVDADSVRVAPRSGASGTAAAATTASAVAVADVVEQVCIGDMMVKCKDCHADKPLLKDCPYCGKLPGYFH